MIPFALCNVLPRRMLPALNEIIYYTILHFHYFELDLVLEKRKFLFKYYEQIHAKCYRTCSRHMKQKMHQSDRVGHNIVKSMSGKMLLFSQKSNGIPFVTSHFHLTYRRLLQLSSPFLRSEARKLATFNGNMSKRTDKKDPCFGSSLRHFTFRHSREDYISTFYFHIISVRMFTL